MIIRVQSCFRKFIGLLLVEHTERTANFHSKIIHSFNHFNNTIKVAV